MSVQIVYNGWAFTSIVGEGGGDDRESGGKKRHDETGRRDWVRERGEIGEERRYAVEHRSRGGMQRIYEIREARRENIPIRFKRRWRRRDREREREHEGAENNER